jgi:hypothetical protein
MRVLIVTTYSQVPSSACCAQLRPRAYAGQQATLDNICTTTWRSFSGYPDWIRREQNCRTTGGIATRAREKRGREERGRGRVAVAGHITATSSPPRAELNGASTMMHKNTVQEKIYEHLSSKKDLCIRLGLGLCIRVYVIAPANNLNAPSAAHNVQARSHAARTFAFLGSISQKDVPPPLCKKAGSSDLSLLGNRHTDLTPNRSPSASSRFLFN